METKKKSTMSDVQGCFLILKRIRVTHTCPQGMPTKDLVKDATLPQDVFDKKESRKHKIEICSYIWLTVWDWIGDYQANIAFKGNVISKIQIAWQLKIIREGFSLDVC